MSTHDVFAAVVASSATDGYPRGHAWRAAVRLGGVAWAALTLLGVSLPVSALARTSCVYAGAPVNTLTVRVNDDSIAEITRVGMDITVRPQDGPLTRCAGGTATVLNTDTIKVVLVDLDFVDLDLSGGPFAPGATPETEGSSEIEIQISTDLGVADIIGTPGDDEWHWGPGGPNPALNLNPRESGDQDVDVTITSEEDEFGPLVANGDAGNDTIIGAPGAQGAAVRGAVTSNGGGGDDVLSAPGSAVRLFDLGGAELNGGPGNDLISGGKAADDLDGGAGEDRIDGRGGADDIAGGPGRDRLVGGAGQDTIKSRDFARDSVSCGPGRDRVTADRRDRVSGCEQTRRR